MQPVTPPRSARSSRKQTVLPYTPPTPFPTKSPRKVVKPSSQTLSPVKLRSSHLQTPNPTPRHRKKNTQGLLLGDAFNFHSTSTTRTLFPPTPSTVGSGRSKDVFKSPLRQRVEHSPVSRMLDSPEQELSVGITKRKLLFNIESDGDDEGMDVEVTEPPMTPEKKVISREMAEQWVEQVPVSVEDDDVFIEKKSLVNPFITSTSPKEFVLKRPTKPLDFVEYVNKKGDKIVKKAGSLDDFEEDALPLKFTKKGKTFKPKNLFGGLTSEKSTSFEVYHDDE